MEYLNLNIVRDDLLPRRGLNKMRDEVSEQQMLAYWVKNTRNTGSLVPIASAIKIAVASLGVVTLLTVDKDAAANPTDPLAQLSPDRSGVSLREVDTTPQEPSANGCGIRAEKEIGRSHHDGK